VTAPSVAFVQSVVSGDDERTQAERLRAAADAHAKAGRDAASGRGFDRHLFALQARNAQGGGDANTADADAATPAATATSSPPPPPPPLFSDEAFMLLAANELSTTNMTDPLTVETPWAFGPVHPHGVGVGYHVSTHELGFSVTAYAPQDAAAFSRELETSLDLIGRLLALQPLAPVAAVPPAPRRE
jgi:carnitine O-acetyltransferase